MHRPILVWYQIDQEAFRELQPEGNKTLIWVFYVIIKLAHYNAGINFMIAALVVRSSEPREAPFSDNINSSYLDCLDRSNYIGKS